MKNITHIGPSLPQTRVLPSNRCHITTVIATLLTAAALCITTSDAAIIYYEGFNYGAVDGSLAGQNGGTGFSGAWTSGNPGITYASAGLSFSDLSVSGGSVTATGTDGIGNAIFYRPLTSTLSGVYYGSFLSQVVNTSQFFISNGMALGPQNTFPGTDGFGILAPFNADALAVNQGTSITFNGSTLNIGQIYLILFKIDAVANTTKGWLLSAGQYDTFKVGGITEAELDAATLGTGNNQLWARASVTGSESVIASHLNIYLNAFGGVSATLAEDEFRLSNTSLDEVSPRHGSATWKASPATGDWNTANNWTPRTVPNSPSDTATFASSNTTGISVSLNMEVNGIVFNAGASAFIITASPSSVLTISGVGITNNSGITQNFVTAVDGGANTVGQIVFANSATAGSLTAFTNNGSAVSGAGGGNTEFHDTSTAGSGTFTTNGGTVPSATPGVTNFVNTSTAGNGTFTTNGGAVSGAPGGFTEVHDTSTAGNGTFTINAAAVLGAGGGFVYFADNSTAGNATLIANDGQNGGLPGLIQFYNDSTGGTARVELFGQMDISGHNAPGVAVGSIEGSGAVFLGSFNLTVGGNDLDTTFSGIIQDGGQYGGTGGSLTKTGTRRLNLTTANTYTGGTTISGGTLLVRNKSGSATGTGAVQVNAGTLGGTGIIAGAVTVGPGTSSRAILFPGKSATSPGTLTINSALTFNSLSTYKCVLNRSTLIAGEVTALGVTINSGATFTFVDTGTGTLTVGTVFTVINNTSASPITGAFSNLANGAMFTSNGNNFQASYTGGTGNDLTLTVVP
jgi:autotransporter-associated beta strand protein